MIHQKADQAAHFEIGFLNDDKQATMIFLGQLADDGIIQLIKVIAGNYCALSWRKRLKIF